MQKTHSSTNEFDPSMLEHFKETFLTRRSFVKTHNTNEILTEYPALRIHSCVCTTSRLLSLFEYWIVFVLNSY